MTFLDTLAVVNLASASARCEVQSIDMGPDAVIPLVGMHPGSFHA